MRYSAQFFFSGENLLEHVQKLCHEEFLKHVLPDHKIKQGLLRIHSIAATLKLTAKQCKPSQLDQ